MFQRILIGNRGEVAVRIARTAREMSIAPIGIASRADLCAGWLSAMEEVVCVGDPSPRESYLQAERIVQAAVQTGCSALHPGWGFLSENPRFAALCEQHGVTFIGPPAGVMRRMGLKTPAKMAMRNAGLPVIPGSDGLLAGVDEAVAQAAEIGFPVILKADAGGGGRGMRRCSEPAELAEAFAAATAEAQAAFGNGKLYLEKYLTGGRHIEVQLLVDRFGKAVHLFERECSIQRNHQKLLEESPSPALSPKERAEIGAAAARAAAAIGYVGAGTIEFLRDGDGKLYFMEMNTRLQVEHPVSEAITGIDIVKAQIRIAANERLELEQPRLAAKGCAIECRINAEDPSQGFRPSPGKIAVLEIPKDKGPGTLRVDTHLAAGDEVSPYYDSLVAKVIAHAPARAGAIETMLRALASARIEGIATTIPLHLEVLVSEEFRTGKYDTSRIPGASPAVARSAPPGRP